MAKSCMKAREQKREKTVAKYAEKRALLKAAVKDLTLSEEARFEAVMQLQKLPRDASPVRLRNRCHLTGRPHGVYRKFKLCRNKLRQVAMAGYVPGLTKASW